MDVAVEEYPIPAMWGEATKEINSLITKRAIILLHRLARCYNTYEREKQLRIFFRQWERLRRVYPAYVRIGAQQAVYRWALELADVAMIPPRNFRQAYVDGKVDKPEPKKVLKPRRIIRM